jgi:hypothetical protein
LNGDLHQKNGGTATLPVKPSNIVRSPATQSWQQNCHAGVHLIGTVNEMRLHAARRAAVDPWQGPDRLCPRPFALVVSLLGRFDFTPPIRMSVGAQKLLGAELGAGVEVPHVLFDWPDFGTMAELDRAWWESFAAKLATVKGDVVVFCEGGHGRTGTMVSILATLLGLVPATECPVQWLRAKYCKEVVESAEQIRYIEHMTGRVCIADVRMDGWGFHSSSGVGGTAATVTKAAQKVDRGYTLSKKKLKVWLRHGVPDYSVKIGQLMDMFVSGDIIKLDGDFYEFDNRTRQFLRLLAPSATDKVWAFASSADLLKKSSTTAGKSDAPKAEALGSIGIPARPLVVSKFDKGQLDELWLDITDEYSGLNPHTKTTGWTLGDIDVCRRMFERESA